MTDDQQPASARRKGRAALTNPPDRYQARSSEELDDGWHRDDAGTVHTSLEIDHARAAISWNASPDIPYDRAVNPYRGCEHGCIYCYARPSHAWLDLSPGLDFESRLFHRPDLPERLRDELAARSYRPAPLAIGSVTDAYQPVERDLGLTRRVLELLVDCRHPFTIVTKSALVERDMDLIGEAADQGTAQVAISLTTLQHDLAQRMEPRAASPARRLRSIEQLSRRGIPVAVMVAPLIPVLTDHELERLLTAGHDAGAVAAGYALLRLPGEVSPLFRQWLMDLAPERFDRVMNRVCETHRGRDGDSRFGHRMGGDGPYADILAQRFRLASRRLGLNEPPALRSDRFRPPDRHGQLSLF
jgi:DNA repair photolyase